jgi:NAD(P)-dependent dehydrogenase (short-subunit alcohol dehydrogenase family)
MSNSVVLITGGLTGIGRAAAVALAKKCAKVVVAGRRAEAGNPLVKELRALGAEAEFINADVRKDDDVRNMVDKTVSRFGHLDVAVNNAATEGQVGPITDQTAESFAATFYTNVRVNAVAPGPTDTGMLTRFTGTAANKAALAAALGLKGIRVNAAAPGVVETGMSIALGMQALKRIAQPDDIGGVIAFLASDAARWITGDTVRVDGGSKL